MSVSFQRPLPSVFQSAGRSPRHPEPKQMPIESIFLVGHFIPGALGLSYQRAFNSIGVRTQILDPRETRDRIPLLMRNRIAHRLTIDNGFIRSRSFRAFNRWLEDSVIQSGAQALLSFPLDLVLAKTLDNIRRAGIRVACFYADNPFPPHYGARPETLPAARAADLCLIWSERLVDKLSAAGVANPAFLPFAWDPEVFPYQSAQPQGTWPGVLFLGGWDREREKFLEELSLHVPLRIYGPAYWGTRTKPFSRVRACWQRSALRLTDAARAIRESAVCLNVLRTQHIIDGKPDGTIMRHFEVPGAGGFLLSTRSGGATRLFPEGETGEYFSDIKECIEKAKSYIANDSSRRQLAERAHAAVAAQHQYKDRARQILHMLEQTHGSGQQ